MNTIILLCVFIWLNSFVINFLSARKPSAREDEERIVVKELASMIRNSREKFKNYPTDVEYEEKSLPKNDDSSIPDKSYSYDISDDGYKGESDPSFSYVPQPVAHDKKEPFAVPPTDQRYYQKDFVYDAEPLHAPPATDRAPITTSSTRKKPLNETEEEIQRRKLYAHLTLNPSFIPYGQVQSIRIPPAGYYYDDKNATHFLALTYGTVCAILVITSGAAYVFCRKLRKNVKDAEDVDYPAYGVTGPNKDTPAPTGDRHLAHSAQMYHYQHQKQQIIAMEKNTSPTKIRKGTESGSEEDDLTVYECPGLAPVTGEMEVKNPMFQEEEEVKTSNVTKDTADQKNSTNSDEKKSPKQ